MMASIDNNISEKNSAQGIQLSDKDYRRKFIIHRSNTMLDLKNIVLTILAWLFTMFCFRDVLYAIFDIKTDIMYNALPQFIKEWLNFELHSVTAITPPWRVVILTFAFIVIVLLLEIVWVAYNRITYGGADRRKRRPNAAKEEILKLYNITEEQYEAFQNGKCLSLGFDEGAKVNSIKNLD